MKRMNPHMWCVPIPTETIKSSTEPIRGVTSYTPEPTWGKRQMIDREEELRQWQQINTDDTYVHRVCSTCGDSMLQRKENPSLTCRQCRVLDVMEDQEGTRTGNSKKKGYEQMNRDDEQEYSRIPIAGENDSDYDVFEDLYDSSYSQESDEDEKSSVNKLATNYVAYAIAPNVPGEVAKRTWYQPIPLSNRYDNLYLQGDIDEPVPAMEQTSSPSK
jgi:hypothetical protein